VDRSVPSLMLVLNLPFNYVIILESFPTRYNVYKLETLSAVSEFWLTVWSSPVRIIICMGLLYQQLGISRTISVLSLLLYLLPSVLN
jgi:hypothetical protein